MFYSKFEPVEQVQLLRINIGNKREGLTKVKVPQILVTLEGQNRIGIVFVIRSKIKLN